MTLARVTLESFETELTLPPNESADYLRGFHDALAQAAQSETAERNRAVADVAAALDDMTFGFAEARTHLLDRIHPLLAQIAELLLPEIAKETFEAHLIEIVSQNFKDAFDCPIKISVAPDVVDNFGDFLEKKTGQFLLSADPTVTLGQAILMRDDTHIMIDFPALLEALQAALLGLEPSERTQSNG